jgi:hypothetical protein
MSFRLRPVAEQTIVLTGESSGIGRARRNPGAGLARSGGAEPARGGMPGPEGSGSISGTPAHQPMLAVHGESSEAPVQ